MPPEIIPDDEEYASEEDSDFAPDAIVAEEKEESSDEESEPEDTTIVKTKPKTAKRKRGDEEAEDVGFENSGDEAIIGEGVKEKKRRKRKGKDKGAVDVGDDDEGGEGGLIKTRSQRAQEKVEKKPLADTSAATIDVDAVWQAMISGKPVSNPSDEPKPSTEPSTILSPKSPSAQGANTSSRDGRDLRSSSTLSEGPDSLVMIKRTYNFAGKVHTEQKLVPRNSAEAKLFLASQLDPASTPAPENTPSDPFINPKRPPKLARRSVFEPIVEGLLKRTDLHFGVRKDSGVELTGITGKEKKLNTVEKSAMDWAGFVDKAGIKDDLDAAGKSKGAYRARQEFLARVEQKKEEDARRARGLPV